MPELPEVEAARRMIDHALTGRTLTEVVARPDDIVFEGVPPEATVARLMGQTVRGTGRRGKFMWLELEESVLFLHLGMSGAILDLTPGQERNVNYYRVRAEAKPGEEPRFLKLELRAGDRRIAFVDGRRLGRIWSAERPEGCHRYAALGPDAHLELPDAATWAAMVQRRKAPIKALLLDQKFLAGIGNYLADEVLLVARIRPDRPAASLSADEAEALRGAIRDIVGHAVAVDADYERFPEDWLFHVRWGGGKGSDLWQGHELRRDTVGGRTTAWVPDMQK